MKKLNERRAHLRPGRSYRRAGLALFSALLLFPNLIWALVPSEFVKMSDTQMDIELGKLSETERISFAEDLLKYQERFEQGKRELAKFDQRIALLQLDIKRLESMKESTREDIERSQGALKKLSATKEKMHPDDYEKHRKYLSDRLRDDEHILALFEKEIPETKAVIAKEQERLPDIKEKNDMWYKIEKLVFEKVWKE